MLQHAEVTRYYIRNSRNVGILSTCANSGYQALFSDFSNGRSYSSFPFWFSLHPPLSPHPSFPLCHFTHPFPLQLLFSPLSSVPTAEIKILSVTPLCPFSLVVVWDVPDHDQIYAHPDAVCYTVTFQRTDGSQPAMNITVTDVTLMENKTVVSCNCTVYLVTMSEPHLFIRSQAKMLYSVPYCVGHV